MATDAQPPPTSLLHRIAETEADLTRYVREQTGLDDVAVAIVLTPLTLERAR